MVKQIVVKTGGMTCTSCEKTIANALMKVDGIMEAKPDYATETTKIKYDENKVDLDKIRDAIDGAGYDFGGEVQEKKGGFKIPFFGK